jgi:hypothetical protein
MTDHETPRTAATPQIMRTFAPYRHHEYVTHELADSRDDRAPLDAALCAVVELGQFGPLVLDRLSSLVDTLRRNAALRIATVRVELDRTNETLEAEREQSAERYEFAMTTLARLVDEAEARRARTRPDRRRPEPALDAARYFLNPPAEAPF